MAKPYSNHPRVFISYSHDSEEHASQVLTFSKRLRAEGIDCSLDQYQQSPRCGWAKWTLDEIRQADFVIVVCSRTYHRRFEDREQAGIGKGVRWEGAMITQEMFFSDAKNEKFLPTILSSSDITHVPVVLRDTTLYDVSKPDGYERLYRRITDQPLNVKSSLGKVRMLPRETEPSLNEPGDEAGAAKIAKLNTDRHQKDPLNEKRPATVELIIDRPFDTFRDGEQDRLLTAIKELLNIAGDIRVTRKRRGSVWLKLELTRSDAERLLEATQSGALAGLGVVYGKLVDAWPNVGKDQIEKGQSRLDNCILEPEDLGIADREIHPMSFAQERLWFLNQLAPDTSLFNLFGSIRVDLPLETEVLFRTLNKITQRHELLRSTFRILNGRPMQLSAQSLSSPCLLMDLSNLSKSERQVVAKDFALEQARFRFNLEGGPLFSVAFLRTTTINDQFMLLLTMHHIISDNWSMNVLLDEFKALYRAYSLNLPNPLPSIPITYSDFSLWQRAHLKGKSLASQLNYWKKELAGAPHLRMPLDRSRPPVSSLRAGHHEMTLPMVLVRKLRSLSRREHVTLFMTLLGVLNTLLCRYCGQSETVVGSPISGRSLADTESLIGPFENTLALRIDLSGNPTFWRLLGRVREKVLRAYANQDVPFEILVDELEPRHEMNYSPVFQVTFRLYQGQKEESTRLADTFQKIRKGSTMFDLEVELLEFSRGIDCRVIYNPDVFKADTVSRMSCHFQVLLEGIVANPAQRVSEAPILTEGERKNFLAWSNSRTPYLSSKCLHQVFEAQVKRVPGKTAVVYGNDEVTYEDLNRRANRVANGLRRLRMGPESIVGICMERSIESIVALLGVLKAGAACLPLDPAYPRERLAHIVKDSDADLVLAKSKETLPAFSGKLLTIDEIWHPFNGDHAENPKNRADPRSLAYVLFTSGSTGRPNGIGITHLAVARLFSDKDLMELVETDGVAQIANFSFDASIFEIWGALLHGARLIGVNWEERLSPADLAKSIRNQEISIMLLTPGLLSRIVSTTPWVFASLRCLLVGGDSMEPGPVKEILEKGPPGRVLNVYGPTESTTFASWYQVAAIDRQTLNIPIGRPISNTEIYILDANLQLVPIGVPGEIYIGGDGLARCYINLPSLTGEKFIPNRFSASIGSRLYASGDLGRFLADGNIEYLGRRDHQIKIRGFRVELQEIESVLAEHASVCQTVVARTRGEDVQRLVAYVVPNDQHESGVSAKLREYLRERLPEYMVPSRYVRLEALPLTPNGKIDRRALPMSDQEGDAPFVGPRNGLEELLARMWCTFLAVEEVSIMDNFFKLGGHSLLAAQLFSELQTELGESLSIALLFEFPTIAELAAAIEKAMEGHYCSA